MILFIAISVVFVVGFVVWAVKSWGHGGYFDSMDIMMGLFLSSIVMVVVACATLIPYFYAIENFGNADGILHSLPAYEKVIEDTGAIHYEVDEGELIRAGELSLGVAESDRMKEWRDIITEYNKTVGRYKRYSQVPLMWLVIPRIPSELNFIVITK